MVFRIQPARGGSRGKLNPGEFIRDSLASGPTSAHDIYVAYKQRVQEKASPEYMAGARRKIRKQIAAAKRIKPRQRVKVTKEEINANLPFYQGNHPPRIKRHACSYNSFMHYIYIAKKLGLIEDTGQTQEAAGKAGSSPSEWHAVHPAVLIRALPGSEYDGAWSNLWRAYSERK
jgi:hypothetical protein